MAKIVNTSVVDTAVSLVRTAGSILANSRGDSADLGSQSFIGAHLSNDLLSFVVNQNILWPLLEAEHRNKLVNRNCQPEDTGDPLLDTLRAQIASNAEKVANQLKSILIGITPICEPLLLKGACFIAEDDFKPQSWRHMDDLDLLVKATHVHPSVEAVRSLCYESASSNYHVDSDIHYPILKHPSHPVGVEIHQRCMRWPDKGLIDNATLLANASTINSPYGNFLLPNATMRLTYLVANAQIKDNGFRLRVFRLRDVIDFMVLLDKNKADLGVAQSMFQKVSKEDEFLSFVFACEQVLQRSVLSPSAYRQIHKQWTEVAFLGIRNPSTLKRYLAYNWTLLAISILANPSRWKNVYRTLMIGEKRRRQIDKFRKQFRSLN